MSGSKKFHQKIKLSSCLLHPALAGSRVFCFSSAAGEGAVLKVRSKDINCFFLFAFSLLLGEKKKAGVQ
jgi:hypothetical protein